MTVQFPTLAGKIKSNSVKYWSESMEYNILRYQILGRDEPRFLGFQGIEYIIKGYTKGWFIIHCFKYLDFVLNCEARH